jgi:predicted enzyme related to lactoylglutathione lyase
VKKSLLLLAVIILIGSCQQKDKIEQNDASKHDQMNEDILGLRTCAYLVADLDKAKEWYADAFGIKPYFDEPFYVGFNIGGYELGLMPEEDPPAAKAASVLTYWGVHDIQAIYEKLISLGAEPHEEPHNVGGELMVSSVKDPWGNIIGIIYNPEFKIAE